MKMPDDPRFPLKWPFGWKRTAPADRQRFTAREATQVAKQVWDASNQRHVDRVVHGTKPVSMRTACERLAYQLEKVGAAVAVLSTNVELTMAGEPRGDRRDPEDPGAAVYFRLLDKDRVLACDCWQSVAQNIAAIAGHIEALRRIERYGVGTLAQAFTGYDALPAPGADNRAPWRRTFEFKPTDLITPEIVQARYRSMAKQFATNEGALLNLNLAREAALQELSAGPTMSFTGPRL